MAEYLYDKDNPKSPLKGKPLGWESFYRGMPNHFERAEMIGRRILKEYDGDLAKISLVTKKPADRGQKWRTLKNIARVYKNPIGFLLWRIAYTRNVRNHFSIYYFVVGLALFKIATALGMMKQYVEGYKIALGMRGYYPVNGWIEDTPSIGPDTSQLRKKYGNLCQMWKNPIQTNVTTAYWCREQNFRKYFEMRKKHGFKPSVEVKGYYNKHLAKDYYDAQLYISQSNQSVGKIKNHWYDDII